jgi:hypothetical protein
MPEVGYPDPEEGTMSEFMFLVYLKATHRVVGTLYRIYPSLAHHKNVPSHRI